MYFAGFNVDGDYLAGLIRTLEYQAETKGSDYKVMLVITSKSGSTIEPMANFMILEKALQDRNINYEVVAVTDMSDDEHPTVLRSMAIENHWKTYSIPYGVWSFLCIY